MIMIHRKPLLKMVIESLIFIYLLFLYMFPNDMSGILYANYVFYALAGAIMLYLACRRRFCCSPLFIIFAAFILVCFLSAFFGIDFGYSVAKVNSLLKLFIMTVFLYNYLYLEGRFRYLIYVFASAGVLYALYVMIRIGIPDYIRGLMAGRRMGKELNNVNAMGMYVSSSFIILLWNILYGKRGVWLCVLASAPCLIVAFGSGSRKVLVMVALTIVMLSAFKGSGVTRVKAVLIAAVGLLALYMAIRLPWFSALNTRFLSLLSGLAGSKTDGSTEGRLFLIQMGMEQFRKTPLLGVGIANSRYLTEKYWIGRSYLHNNYVELLACAGILGTIPFYLLYAFPLVRLIKPLKEKNKYAVLAVVYMLIKLILQYGYVAYYDKETYMELIMFYLIAEMLQTETYIEGAYQRKAVMKWNV